jgi:D-sedoheptulose 7-phosphate isomerase
LASNSSALTCISNDFGYKNVFSRQIEGLGKKNDVLIIFSTSGNSENILMALKKAKKYKMRTIAFLGKGGGRCKGLSDIDLIVPSQSTARIQEMHILIGHTLCDLVEKKLKLTK